MLRRTFSIGCAASIATLALLGAPAHAQDFPSKPIRIVVPFTAGGGVDTLARMVGQRLSEQTGQPVLIDNKPGAGGNIATAFVAGASADGYTILIGANGLAANTTLYPNQPVEVLRERVTSKGGTTFAAISALDEDGVKPRFKRALHAAQLRAQELGREFGAD